MDQITNKPFFLLFHSDYSSLIEHTIELKFGFDKRPQTKSQLMVATSPADTKLPSYFSNGGGGKEEYKKKRRNRERQ